MKKSKGRKELRNRIHTNKMHDAKKKRLNNDRKYRSLSGKKLYAR